MKVELKDLLDMMYEDRTILPHRIEFSGNVYILCGNGYYDDNDKPLEEQIDCLLTDLNKEVRFLEPIELISRCDDIDMTHYGELYKPSKNEEIMRIKINEVIREFNKLWEKN